MAMPDKGSKDDWFENHDRLSEDQKKILYNEMKNFGKYGDAVYQEADLNEIAKRFEALTEYAKRYLNENASDKFDQVTINRNIKELQKKVRKFKKEAEKVQQHRERLTALYDDIGLIFDRYFGVGDGDDADTIQEEKKLRKVIREEVQKELSR
jgi:regulator of replication initiation timing